MKKIVQCPKGKQTLNDKLKEIGQKNRKSQPKWQTGAKQRNMTKMIENA